jgi:hypothetical protein
MEQAIAEHFGVSRMTVSRAVKKDANRSVSAGGQCEDPNGVTGGQCEV